MLCGYYLSHLIELKLTINLYYLYLVEVRLHVRLGEVVVERGGDVGLPLVDHPHQRPELRRPPLRRPRPPRREARAQPPHRLRHSSNRPPSPRAPPRSICRRLSLPTPGDGGAARRRGGEEDWPVQRGRSDDDDRGGGWLYSSSMLRPEAPARLAGSSPDLFAPANG